MDSAVFILIMDPIALADGRSCPVGPGMIVAAERLPRSALEWLREGAVIAWFRTRGAAVINGPKTPH